MTTAITALVETKKPEVGIRLPRGFCARPCDAGHRWMATSSSPKASSLGIGSPENSLNVAQSCGPRPTNREPAGIVELLKELEDKFIQEKELLRWH